MRTLQVVRQNVVFTGATKQTRKYFVLMEPTGGGPAITPTLKDLDRVRNSQLLETDEAVLKEDRVLEVKMARVE